MAKGLLEKLRENSGVITIAVMLCTALVGLNHFYFRQSEAIPRIRELEASCRDNEKKVLTLQMCVESLDKSNSALKSEISELRNEIVYVRRSQEEVVKILYSIKGQIERRP